MLIDRRGMMAALTAAALAPTAARASRLDRPPATVTRLASTTPDGVEIAVQVTGAPSGLELLFVHGLGQCHLAWSAQVADLAREFRVVTYDNRGHGESGKPLQPEFYADGDRWADELAAVIRAAGLRRPVVIGWSLGGAIVSHYLRRHGDQTLAGVVFVGAVTSYAPEYFEPATGRIVGGLISDRLEERIPATRAFLDACFASRLDADARETMLTYNAMVPSRVHAAIQRLTLEDSGKILRGIGVPVLVIHGAKDRLVRVAMSQRTAALAPRSELTLYPDAGHGPMIDAPAALNRDLALFRRQVA